MLDYIVNESSSGLIRNDHRRKAFEKSITEAIVLNNIYATLQREETALRLTNQMIKIHQNKIAAGNNNKSSIYGTFQQARYSVSDKSFELKIQDWLNRLHQWSIKSYKEIMNFRKLVTGGQQLIYHIMDSSRNIVYEFNEEQYLELLSRNPLTLRWGDMKSIAEKGVPLANFFKLQVGNSKKDNTALQDVAKETGARIITSDLKHDALYNYLTQKSEMVKNNLKGKSGLLHSRIFELYDQIKYSVKDGGWKKDESGNVVYPQNPTDDATGYFFSKKRRLIVDSFIKKYINQKMHKDSIAFYRTGDAIKNKSNLIENKIEGATVSISSIRKAIKNIASLGGVTNRLELYNKLIKMFTYSGDKGLMRSIQEGAKRLAEKEINNTVFGNLK